MKCCCMWPYIQKIISNIGPLGLSRLTWVRWLPLDSQFILIQSVITSQAEISSYLLSEVSRWVGLPTGYRVLLPKGVWSTSFYRLASPANSVKTLKEQLIKYCSWFMKVNHIMSYFVEIITSVLSWPCTQRLLNIKCAICWLTNTHAYQMTWTLTVLRLSSFSANFTFRCTLGLNCLRLIHPNRTECFKPAQ